MTETGPTLLDAIRLAQQAEQKAARMYGTAAKEATNPLVRRLFEQLAEFEDLHYDKLVELEESLRARGKFVAYDSAPRLDGETQPLAAFYSRELLAPLRDLLGRGGRRAREFLGSLDAAYLDIAPGSREARAMVNVNTEAELAEALKELR